MQRSFIAAACQPDHPFPLNNLPYGIFSRKSAPNARAVCAAIGDKVLDLSHLAHEYPHLFNGAHLDAATARRVLSSADLNAFLRLGRAAWTELRALLQDVLSETPQRRDVIDSDAATLEKLLPDASGVDLHLPITIGDYTDFYSSRQHAYNVGCMFRDPANALPPNWEHMPIGYHGRASSVVPTGTAVRRPVGQLRADATKPPTLAPCRLLDFELEMGAVIGGEDNALGECVSIENAGDRVFGLVLMNDWSARDVQKWEYVPLGPFNGKNFATTIGVWVVPLEALESFRGPVTRPNQELLSYLTAAAGVRAHCTWDVELEVFVQTSRGERPSRVCQSNLKFLYWSVAQQLAHHAVCGCNMRAGDLMGSGTISGPNGTWMSLMHADFC